MWTKTFALAVLERAVKTFAQAAAALLTASGIGLLDADWLQILSVAGMAAVVSVLTSSAPFSSPRRRPPRTPRPSG